MCQSYSRSACCRSSLSGNDDALLPLTSRYVQCQRHATGLLQHHPAVARKRHLLVHDTCFARLPDLSIARVHLAAAECLAPHDVGVARHLPVEWEDEMECDTGAGHRREDLGHEGYVEVCRPSALQDSKYAPASRVPATPLDRVFDATTTTTTLSYTITQCMTTTTATFTAELILLHLNPSMNHGTVCFV